MTAPLRSTGASVHIEGLVKDYGAVRAVDHVSLTIEAGEFLALLGPSGSGKTTILMTIAGFERPTSGRILIGDTRVDQVPPHQRGIGMVFQRYALFPHMSVAENVAFPLKMRGIAKDDRLRLVEDALQMVRLDGYGARQPNQLSGGQQQRVALARALVYKPPVLLMDEPLGALDRKLREELQLELRQLQRDVGTTVVYVTHDQSEALTMADRIGVIHEGTMRQVGTPRDLYERPASTFVAGFVGETNLLEAIVVDAGPTPRLRMASGDGVVVAGGERPVDAGAEVRVGIRPERLSLAAGHREGALNGTISQAVYVGDIVRYELDAGFSQSLQVKVPAALDPGLDVGTVASASFDPHVARLFVQPGGDR